MGFLAILRLIVSFPFFLESENAREGAWQFCTPGMFTTSELQPLPYNDGCMECGHAGVAGPCWTKCPTLVTQQHGSPIMAAPLLQGFFKYDFLFG